MPSHPRRLLPATLLLALVALGARPAGAQGTGSAAAEPPMNGVMGDMKSGAQWGGHIGFVVPAVRFANAANGGTTYFTDKFTFGFPVGLTYKASKVAAIDFEFIPTFNTGNNFVLTIHPGLLFAVGDDFAVGFRAAYDANAVNTSYGGTAVFARGFGLGKGLGGFFEIDVPIRSQSPAVGNNFVTAAIAAHVGITF